METLGVRFQSDLRCGDTVRCRDTSVRCRDIRVRFQSDLVLCCCSYLPNCIITTFMYRLEIISTSLLVVCYLIQQKSLSLWPSKIENNNFFIRSAGICDDWLQCAFSGNLEKIWCVLLKGSPVLDLPQKSPNTKDGWVANRLS